MSECCSHQKRGTPRIPGITKSGPLEQHLLAKNQLTDWLDWIEVRTGYTGETAIFLLSWLRGGGQ